MLWTLSRLAKLMHFTARPINNSTSARTRASWIDTLVLNNRGRNASTAFDFSGALNSFNGSHWNAKRRSRREIHGANRIKTKQWKIWNRSSAPGTKITRCLDGRLLAPIRALLSRSFLRSVPSNWKGNHSRNWTIIAYQIAISCRAERLFGRQHGGRDENAGQDDVAEVVVVAKPVAEDAEPEIKRRQKRTRFIIGSYTGHIQWHSQLETDGTISVKPSNFMLFNRQLQWIYIYVYIYIYIEREREREREQYCGYIIIQINFTKPSTS